jgi:hypothetical protein
MPKAPKRNDPWQTDPDVRRWVANLAQGSPKTGECHYRYLSQFLVHAGHDPHELVKLPGNKRDDLVSDYIAYQAGRKLSTSMLKSNKAAIASWLDWNSLRFGRKIKARGQTRPRASRYGLPTNTTLGMALNAGDCRQRAAMALIAMGGFRPEVLGSGSLDFTRSGVRTLRGRRRRMRASSGLLGSPRRIPRSP